ncbi:MAG: ribonuclease HII [Candidatus Aenigmatarchaeota archaeon]
MGLLLGIDEAGKGPVIGPLVIAGCLIDEKDEGKLNELGVRDSKELTPKKRETILAKLRETCADSFVVMITPKQLNAEMDILNLNQIELARVAKIVNHFGDKSPKVVVDSFEANTEKFAEKLRALLKDKSLQIVSENKADKNHPVVGAASIIAKVTRDGEIKKLYEKYGDFGSGYPADPRTIKFLRTLDEKEFPEIVRTKWSTAQRIIEGRKQKGLGDF